MEPGLLADHISSFANTFQLARALADVFQADIVPAKVAICRGWIDPLYYLSAQL